MSPCSHALTLLLRHRNCTPPENLRRGGNSGKERAAHGTRRSTARFDPVLVEGGRAATNREHDWARACGSAWLDGKATPDDLHPFPLPFLSSWGLSTPTPIEWHNWRHGATRVCQLQGWHSLAKRPSGHVYAPGPQRVPPPRPRGGTLWRRPPYGGRAVSTTAGVTMPLLLVLVLPKPGEGEGCPKVGGRARRARPSCLGCPPERNGDPSCRGEGGG